MGQNGLETSQLSNDDIPPVSDCIQPTAPEPTEYVSRKEIKEFNQLLYQATIDDDLDEVVRQLDLGAEINYRSDNDNKNTVLHIYAERGDVQAVEYLLSRNADPNRRNADFWTPLHKAASKGELETVKILIHKDANRSARGYTIEKKW